MFGFMKKDKDKKDKDEKKKEKKEKKDKEKKDKQREPMTQDELKKLDEVKKGVFRRFSDREKRKSAKTTSPDESLVPRDNSDSSLSGGRPSPNRETPPEAKRFELTKPQRLPSKGEADGRPTVAPKPKPRSILKGGGGTQQVSQNLDDSTVLQENTKLNELTAHLMHKSETNQAGKPKNSSPQQQSPSSSHSGVESPIVREKSFKSHLPLPDIVPLKTPRVRELSLQRQPAGDFGFTLRKAFITKKNAEGADESKVVIFAEPGSGTRGMLTGLIPGDKLIEVNGVNVEEVSREEIVEMIRNSGDQVIVKVQPIEELIELSVRPQQDGGSVEVQDEVSKGGTLKRSGSIRFKKGVS